MAKNKIWILLGVGILAVVAAFFFLTNGSSTERKVDTENERRQTMISYLSNPRFSTADFCEQLTHTKAKLEIYQLDERKLYFSISKTNFEGDRTLKKLCMDPSTIEMAKVSNDRLVLGDYRFNDTSVYFFRFPDSLLRVPRKLNLSIAYDPFTYTINDKELTNFISNKSIYGGELYITRNGEELTMAYGMNHGAMVAKKNESSLRRLVAQITQGISSKEQKIQALLTFVTNKIEYNFSEANGGVEVLKRPNEVLMSKSSDCSGKTILFASLLEQIGADYRLAYMKGHISVFVKGKFQGTNGYTLKSDDAIYYLAETTCPDFVIGETILNEGTRFDFIQYVQKVGSPSIVRNVLTGKKFEL